ncbi:MAG: SH3 domain-containing protein [Rhodovibrionaceae bacterium]|nr:SH3 domain-containing protein [Rhodovibrionaceae bacterium]
MWVVLLIAIYALAIFEPAHAAGGQVLHPKRADVALRAAPSGEAEVLRRLNPEARLLLFERRGDWRRVGLFGAVGVEGWVAAEDVSAPAQPAPPPEPKPIRPEPPPLPVFLLEIGGRPALEFTGECRSVGREGSSARRPFADLVPKTYRLQARAVLCRVEKEDFRGRLKALLRRDGKIVAAAETSAPLNYVVVRSDGPWGAAAGWRGNRGLVVPSP